MPLWSYLRASRLYLYTSRGRCCPCGVNIEVAPQCHAWHVHANSVGCGLCGRPAWLCNTSTACGAILWHAATTCGRLYGNHVWAPRHIPVVSADRRRCLARSCASRASQAHREQGYEEAYSRTMVHLSSNGAPGASPYVRHMSSLLDQPRTSTEFCFRADAIAACGACLLLIGSDGPVRSL